MLRHLADSAPAGDTGSSLAITAIFVGVASTLTGAAALVNAVSKLVQAIRGGPRRPASHRQSTRHDEDDGQEGDE